MWKVITGPNNKIREIKLLLHWFRSLQRARGCIALRCQKIPGIQQLNRTTARIHFELCGFYNVKRPRSFISEPDVVLQIQISPHVKGVLFT